MDNKDEVKIEMKFSRDEGNISLIGALDAVRLPMIQDLISKTVTSLLHEQQKRKLAGLSLFDEPSPTGVESMVVTFTLTKKDEDTTSATAKIRGSLCNKNLSRAIQALTELEKDIKEMIKGEENVN